MNPAQLIEIGIALARIAVDLFDGRETEEGARRRVRDILPDEGASERAARDLAASLKLQELAEVDDPGEEP
jgi:hypothetical protein